MFPFRCKRLHPLLATAFQVLHFQKFLNYYGDLPEELVTSMTLLQDEPSPQVMEDLERCPQYIQVMRNYQDYSNQTLSGMHGSTAQYWMVYIKQVHMYLMMIRACKMASLDLFPYTLREMTNIFFACSRPHYSRWMVRYSLNLANINTTHPGMKEVLEKGALSIRRTNKPFSGTPVDMTLEQTVNADAASRQTGIAAFTTSDSARRRWMVTRSARSAIVGSLLLQAGLKSQEDVSKDLKPYRIQKDNDDLKKIQECIKSRMDPFDIEPDTNLYCLLPGRMFLTTSETTFCSVLTEEKSGVPSSEMAASVTQEDLKNPSKGGRSRTSLQLL